MISLEKASQHYVMIITRFGLSEAFFCSFNSLSFSQLTV